MRVRVRVRVRVRRRILACRLLGRRLPAFFPLPLLCGGLRPTRVVVAGEDGDEVQRGAHLLAAARQASDARHLFETRRRPSQEGEHVRVAAQQPALLIEQPRRVLRVILLEGQTRHRLRGCTHTSARRRILDTDEHAGRRVLACLGLGLGLGLN